MISESPFGICILFSVTLNNDMHTSKTVPVMRFHERVDHFLWTCVLSVDLRPFDNAFTWTTQMRLRMRLEIHLPVNDIFDRLTTFININFMCLNHLICSTSSESLLMNRNFPLNIRRWNTGIWLTMSAREFYKKKSLAALVRCLSKSRGRGALTEAVSF